MKRRHSDLKRLYARLAILTLAAISVLVISPPASEGIPVTCEFYEYSDPYFDPRYGDVCAGVGLGCFDCYCVLPPGQPYNCLP